MFAQKQSSGVLSIYARRKALICSKCWKLAAYVPAKIYETYENKTHNHVRLSPTTPTQNTRKRGGFAT